MPDVRGGFRGLDGDGTSQVCDVLCVRCSAGSTLTCAGRCLLAGSRKQRALPLHRERRQPSGAGCVCCAKCSPVFIRRLMVSFIYGERR